MKKRNKFVSNSSSSSFTIQETGKYGVCRLCKEKVPIVSWPMWKNVMKTHWTKENKLCHSSQTDNFDPWLDENIFGPEDLIGLGPMIEEKQECPDCKGTGKYEGLFEVSKCETCDGTGLV